MRRIREALRLVYQQGLSRNQAAQALGVGKTTLTELLQRFRASGLPLEQAFTLKDEDLGAHLYAAPARRPSREIAEPDLEHLARELKRPGMTLKLLWQEYRKDHAQGLGYTQFCERFKRQGESRDLVMRQVHKPGEKAMVDYSGDRLELVDAQTGEARPIELFVLIWAASGLVYAEAQESQRLPDWTMGHVRAFEAFGCVPSIVVPDCLRSAVTQAHRYDPELNRTYVEMCAHYGIVAMPARPGRPRDKGKVENAVRLVQQRIVAVLRNEIFHALADLNAAVRREVERLNEAPMKSYDGKCRRELFEEIDRPAARPIPQDRWIYRQWLVRRVGPDYCFEIERHWYSAPHALAGKSLDVCVTAHSVEAYLDQERVAVHARVHRRFGHTIQEAHMPESHRKALPVSLEQVLWRAQRVGPHMRALIQARIESVPHPVIAVRACLGLVRQAENCAEPARAERAAAYALTRRMLSCREYERVLDSRAAERCEEEETGVVTHGNLHGLSLWAQEA